MLKKIDTLTDKLFNYSLFALITSEIFVMVISNPMPQMLLLSKIYFMTMVTTLIIQILIEHLTNSGKENKQ